MLLTSLNLGFPVPQGSGHLPMIKQLTENFQPSPVSPSQGLSDQIHESCKGMGGGNTFAHYGSGAHVAPTVGPKQFTF